MGIMVRATQTDIAVLAALSVAPMTGYALRDAIIADLGAFWAESFGQIYPTLDRLATAGYVSTLPGARRGSSQYRLTPTGEEHLLTLMQTAPVEMPPRNGLLLRLFFGRTLGPAACRELVVKAHQRAEAQLSKLIQIRSANASEAATADSPYWLITISAGEHQARAAIAWAEETLAVLDGLPGPAPVRDGHHAHTQARIVKSQGADGAITPEPPEERGLGSH
jgi:DNA-binding PadR family transcriptional regulator